VPECPVGLDLMFVDSAGMDAKAVEEYNGEQD